MNRISEIIKFKILIFLPCLSLLISQSSIGQTKDTPALRLVEIIPLPDVAGRIDHLAYDNKRKFVYVAALGNNTIEVVDLKNKKVAHTIKGLSEPQGIRFIGSGDLIFVANGGNGVCNIFNANTYQLVNTIKLKSDADNVRYDSSASRIYVGYGNGGISIIDASTLQQSSEVKLSGHPESFQFDNNKIFVNVPDAHIITVVDLAKNAIDAEWKIKEASSNFPMALDAADHRLFIGCRHPSKLIIIDTDSGKTITSLEIDGDTDDIFYSGSAKRIFVSCGSGYVDVIEQITPDSYKMIYKIKTSPGARTSLFVPELGQLVVAAPSHSGTPAQLMIYEIK